MDSRLELYSGAGMNNMGRLQQDRAQRSSARRGRVEMHRGLRGRGGRWSSARGRVALINRLKPGSIGEIVALVSEVDPMGDRYAENKYLSVGSTRAR
jgi:hypothetical protein